MHMMAIFFWKPTRPKGTIIQKVMKRHAFMTSMMILSLWLLSLQKTDLISHPTISTVVENPDSMLSRSMTMAIRHPSVPPKQILSLLKRNSGRHEGIHLFGLFSKFSFWILRTSASFIFTLRLKNTLSQRNQRLLDYLHSGERCSGLNVCCCSSIELRVSPRENKLRSRKSTSAKTQDSFVLED